jgi:hypothetical protein
MSDASQAPNILWIAIPTETGITNLEMCVGQILRSSLKIEIMSKNTEAKWWFAIDAKCLSQGKNITDAADRPG